MEKNTESVKVNLPLGFAWLAEREIACGPAWDTGRWFRVMVGGEPHVLALVHDPDVMAPYAGGLEEDPVRPSNETVLGAVGMAFAGCLGTVPVPELDLEAGWNGFRRQLMETVPGCSVEHWGRLPGDLREAFAAGLDLAMGREPVAEVDRETRARMEAVAYGQIAELLGMRGGAPATVVAQVRRLWVDGKIQESREEESE